MIKFKVGDRVRLKKNLPNNLTDHDRMSIDKRKWNEFKDKIGTVIIAASGLSLSARVRWDYEISDAWWIREQHLTKVKEA